MGFDTEGDYYSSRCRACFSTSLFTCDLFVLGRKEDRIAWKFDDSTISKFLSIEIELDYLSV